MNIRIKSRMLLTFILCCCLLVGVGVWTAYFKRPHISFRNQSDGFAYYLPLRSYLYDSDFDFTNENEAFENTYNASPYYWQTQTKKNYPVYHYSVGSSILWSPFLLLFGTYDYANHMRTPLIEEKPQVIEGFSIKDLNALTIGTYFYAILALLLSFSLLLKLKKKHYLVALISVLVTVFATPFLYYYRYQPLMSHALSAFSISLFLFLWLLQVNRYPWYRFLYLGIALGLAALVRWQDVTLGAVFIIEIVVNKLQLNTKFFKWLAFFPIFILGALLSFAPQLLFWKSVYGKYFVIPQGSSFFSFSAPYLLKFLFSYRHGVFSWSPIVLISLSGLILGLFKKGFRSLKKIDSQSFVIASFLIVTLIAFYINSSISDWHGSDSFGARRIVSLLPVFATGIYLLLLSLKRRIQMALISILLILSVYNILFVDLFYQNKFNHSVAVSPSEIVSTIINISR